MSRALSLGSLEENDIDLGDSVSFTCLTNNFIGADFFDVKFVKQLTTLPYRQFQIEDFTEQQIQDLRLQVMQRNEHQ